ncbi:MAG TPA: polysaccharide biosynthesis C-terminal domain-containing protein [Chitinophagaceae bacterium]|nr:polysaccharide biosynthesis C-terminal domain-containing protein [Chitinophagaceae bacterium]
MSNIRRQSIISSLVIYIGFAVGLLNTYFFTKEGTFSEAEYGLTTIFIAIATMMSAFASMAMPSFIFKFYPYYNDNLPPKKNDMITWSLLVSLVGFLLVVIAGLSMKHLVIQKFGTNAPRLVNYYYWIFPMGLGLTIYSVLEAYAWSLHKSVLTNFFREVQWRLFTTLLIVLYITHIISDYDLFIKLFSFTYLGIAVSLFIYLLVTGKIHFTFQRSKVSRRFYKKILALCSFVYGGTLIFTLSQVFDTIVIASVLEEGAAKAGIFGLATIMTSIIQAPQRGIVSASVAHLSKAWKDKNITLIQKIYQRSSINQLIFACAIFLLIWLNFHDGIIALGVKASYLDAGNIFFLLGLTKIIDMGTGVNSQIIGTSTFWRFELLSGILLLSIMLPLTYWFAKEFGLIGPAIATIISISIYNTIRIVFLWKKFKLFPFTRQTLYTLLLAAAAYAISYFLLHTMHGFMGIVLRSGVFIILYAIGVWALALSPDIQPVWQTIQKRLGIKIKD